jgi:hypothetical protein
MKQILKDIEFKLISFVATGYSVGALGAMIEGSNYDTVTQIGYIFGGITVAFVYVKKVVTPFIRIDKPLAVTLASLPFVFSWYLISDPVHAKYIDIFVDSHYREYKAESEKLRYSSKKLIDIEMDIKGKKAQVSRVNRSELFSLETNKEVEKAKIKATVEALRIEWKKSKKKITTEYHALKNRYKKNYGDFGNGTVAIQDFTNMLYRERVQSLKEKFDTIDSINRNKAVNSSDKVLIERLKIDTERYKNLINKIKKIEEKDKIGIEKFQLIMILFGIFLEVFLTHISYWIGRLTPQSISNNIDIKEVVSSEKRFLKLVEMTPNYRLNSIFAVLRCYAHGEKLTEKNIEKWSYFINNKTNQKYKTGKVGLKAKKHLLEFGILEDNINEIDLNVLKNIIQEFSN